ACVLGARADGQRAEVLRADRRKRAHVDDQTGDRPESHLGSSDQSKAYLARCSRKPIWTSSSSLDRKRERSFGDMGGGPLDITPAARSCAFKSRVARRLPIESSLKTCPFVPRTRPPASRQRAASGISAVTTTSPGRTFSTIQSSAASGP